MIAADNDAELIYMIQGLFLMSNPKFLNVEKKVPYNIRLPKRLIDKLNAYAELSGNTTTNIINNVLSDFLSDKNVLNDYLDNTGGVTVKIPYATNQKYNFISNEWNLKDYNSTETLVYYVVDTRYSETYFAELFEIKRISNNLDIYNGDSYVANKKQLLFNKNAIHSGIELFIYNITETIFADALLIKDFDSFINCLYCLYFEVTANDDVNVYLIDYLTAINLLSASGNDEYKDLIIAAATELKDIDNVVSSFKDDFNNGELEIADKYLHGDQPDNATYSKAVDELHEKINAECKAKCDELVNVIADGYNSNNIIRFGTDIFSRLAIKEIKDKETGFLDEIVDELVDEKFEIAIDERLNDIITEKIDEIFDKKIGELEKVTANIDAKIDNLNDLFESELNKTNK